MKSVKSMLASFFVVSMAFALTSCGGNPIGTWRQDVAPGSGTIERYCLYTLNSDHTLDYLDHTEYNFTEVIDEDTGGGTWTQSGSHVETTITLDAL